MMILAIRTGWTLEYVNELSVEETLDLLYTMNALEKAYGN